MQEDNCPEIVAQKLEKLTTVEVALPRVTIIMTIPTPEGNYHDGLIFESPTTPRVYAWVFETVQKISLVDLSVFH